MVTRDLAALVDTGALTRTGANKATRYHLNIAITPLSSLDEHDIA
ncbi:hypothetical protein [Caulobacter endophyticus]|nr:hypothetical protein [Caulobacter endophyticus]MDG2528047.1 hypothetical protein [Caulobacter endophyticus]